MYVGYMQMLWHLIQEIWTSSDLGTHGGSVLELIPWWYQGITVHTYLIHWHASHHTHLTPHSSTHTPYVVHTSTYTPQWKSESVSHSVVFDSLQPMDCSLPGSSVHGILQARILEWIAIPFSRGIFLTQGSNLGLLHCWWVLYCLSHQGRPTRLRDTHTKPYAAHNKHTHIHLIHMYRPCCTHTPHTPCACSARRLALHPLRTTSLKASPVPPARGWIRRRSGGPLPDPSSLHCRCLSSPAEDGLLKARWVFSHVSTLFPHPCTSIALRTSANTSGKRICSSSDKSPVDQ